jgi:hypothetical protein
MERPVSLNHGRGGKREAGMAIAVGCSTVLISMEGQTKRDLLFFGLGAMATLAVVLWLWPEPAASRTEVESEESESAPDAAVSLRPPAAPDRPDASRPVLHPARSGESPPADAGRASLDAGSRSSSASPDAVEGGSPESFSAPAKRPVAASSPGVEALPPGNLVYVSSAGSIVASVRFRGSAPAASLPRLSLSPGDHFDYCRDRVSAVSPVVIDGRGMLRDTVLYFSWGLPPLPPPTDPVEVEIRRCAFQPAVVAATVGQQVRVTNHDKTRHALDEPAARSLSRTDGPWSFTFSSPGLQQIDCIGGEKLPVFVVADFLHAVTNQAGQATIPNVPEGTYVLRAWHPALGEKEQLVTVIADRETQVTFDFDSRDLHSRQ